MNYSLWEFWCVRLWMNFPRVEIFTRKSSFEDCKFANFVEWLRVLCIDRKMRRTRHCRGDARRLCPISCDSLHLHSAVPIISLRKSWLFFIVDSLLICDSFSMTHAFSFLSFLARPNWFIIVVTFQNWTFARCWEIIHCLAIQYSLFIFNKLHRNFSPSFWIICYLFTISTALFFLIFFFLWNVSSASSAGSLSFRIYARILSDFNKVCDHFI